MKKIYIVLSGLLLLAACASDKEIADMPVDELYNQAFDDLENTKYKAAAAKFEKVETDHPYSKWAVKAKLMSAYAYYKDEKYDDAIMALDRFIRYHPGNKDIPYALYMKGICYYDQIAAADKDQGNTQKAEETFAYLIAMYPDSKYADDARQKIKLTTDYRAGQEMVVGRYYLNEGNYLSALNRFNVVLENYQTTVQIEEALYRQVEIYAIFGMPKYADGYYKILKSNYPKGMWTEKAAKIMEKISNGSAGASQSQTEVSEAKKEARDNGNDKGWFDWLKFGSDDKKTADVEQSEVKTETKAKAKAEVKTETKEENKGWFDWLKFGSDKDGAVAEKSSVPEEVQENTGEEGSTLLSWWANRHKNSE